MAFQHKSRIFCISILTFYLFWGNLYPIGYHQLRSRAKHSTVLLASQTKDMQTEQSSVLEW